MANEHLAKPYQRILVWGSAVWVVSAIIGAVLAFLLDRPYGRMMVTANDVAVLILLLPWFIGSIFAEGGRSTAKAAAMSRAWAGTGSAATLRDLQETMSGKSWLGPFESGTAFIALVVLVFDLLARLLLAVGWWPFPVYPY